MDVNEIWVVEWHNVYKIHAKIWNPKRFIKKYFISSIMIFSEGTKMSKLICMGLVRMFVPWTQVNNTKEIIS